jgi:starch-binding outer membrane protein, SusD/RagB family
MKQRIKITAISVLLIFFIQGCKKDFLNRPPLASPTAGTFYANDNDVFSGTGPLYNASWNSYNGTTMNAIGDVLGGNLVWDNYQGRGAYINFAVPSTDPSGSLTSSYKEFW